MKKFLSRLYQNFFPSAIKVQTMEKNLSDLTGKALESSLLMLRISSSFNHVSGAMNDLLTRNVSLIHKFDSQGDSELLYTSCLQWCQQWFPESYKSFMDVPKQKGLH